MSAVAFDTLKLARTLRDTAHMTQEQAEGIADALAEAMSGAELATKADIRELAASTKADIARFSESTKADIARLSESTKADFTLLSESTKADTARLSERIERRAAEIEGRFIKWVLGTGIAAILAIIAAAWAIMSRLPAPHP